MLIRCSGLLSDAKEAVKKLREADETGMKIAPGREQAVYFRDNVLPVMTALRYPIDELENMVDKKLWPVPAYGDLLFEV